MKFLQSKAARILGTFAVALFAIAVLISLSELYVRVRVPVVPTDYQVSVDSWDKGYVSLKGSWVKADGTALIPLRVSNITCNAAEKKCAEARASISEADQLSVEQESYDISRWDERFLVYSGAAQCVEAIYTVNRDTRQVSGSIQPRKGQETRCQAGSNEVRLKLASGADVYRQAQKEIRPATLNVIGLIFILFWAALRIQNIKGSPADTMAGPMKRDTK